MSSEKRPDYMGDVCGEHKLPCCDRVGLSLQQRAENHLLAPGIRGAAMVAHQYGGIDGEHHKQWVIDQMLRQILGAAGYETWLNNYNAQSEAFDLAPWDQGVAP